MDISWDTSKREEFKSILLMLGQEQGLLEGSKKLVEIYERIEKLYMASHDPGESYGKKFRHYYSDIFQVLSSMSNGLQSGDINTLGQNLETIYTNYTPLSCDVSMELKKIYDHVSLDIARILYSDAGDYRISNDKAMKQLRGDIEAAQESQKRVEQELSGQQREYVAILGIFAAVVLAFTGGLAFSTSVLNNIDKVETCRLIVVALVIGLVLVNILFGLFYYVNRIVNTTLPLSSLWPLVISNSVMLGAIIVVYYMQC